MFHNVTTRHPTLPSCPTSTLLVRFSLDNFESIASRIHLHPADRYKEQDASTSDVRPIALNDHLKHVMELPSARDPASDHQHPRQEYLHPAPHASP